MSKAKKPEVGDRVMVYAIWSDEEVEGEVTWVGSSQFTWVRPGNEQIFFTQFNGMWRKIDGPE